MTQRAQRGATDRVPGGWAYVLFREEPRRKFNRKGECKESDIYVCMYVGVAHKQQPYVRQPDLS